jgi:diacylglycerol kinase family enzyme
MKPDDLVEGLNTILAHSPVFSDKSLIVDVIANPKAGGFSRIHHSKKRFNELKEMVKRAVSLPKRASPFSLKLHLTERCGHAAAIVQRILDHSPSNGKDSYHLIMTAGGDGTSLETAERLSKLPESEKDRFGIVRLPFGTGNDGSEGRTLIVALERLLGPARFERRPALCVTPNEDGGALPRYSFNIASIGLDAYVADMTNRLKRAFPGDSYKFWVNVGTLFYDRVYNVVEMGLKAWNKEKLLFDSKCPRLLVAMGASGNRQYGSNKKILPTEDNCVAVAQTNLFRKLVLKGPIEHGRHENIPELVHFTADKLLIEYSERVPLQCDGETEILAKCDFPLTIERIYNAYNVLVPA